MMEKILAGVRRFRNEIYPQQSELFRSLARRPPQPLALFITCSDARVHPNLITQTEPNELFLVRNAGNMIPPHGASAGGEAATVEYSIEVLGIRNIIICGHSQCGAMQYLMNPARATNLPAAESWFRNADATRRIMEQKYRDSTLSREELAVIATEQNVLVQLNNLSTHPSVAARLASGDVQVFGWYYDIGSGQIRQYDQRLSRFVELQGDAVAADPLPSLAAC